MTDSPKTFDRVAERYDRYRPQYPQNLYSKLLQAVRLDPSSQVLEIGIGPGTATLPILKTGCRLIAVEPGEQFSQLCQEKFSSYPNFSVITEQFETVKLPTENFDLIFSASAFHWIPEHLGFPKAFSLLKKNGVLALFSHHPNPYAGDVALARELKKIYDHFYCSFWKKPKTNFSVFDEEKAKMKCRTGEKFGFDSGTYYLFHVSRTLSSSDYLRLLSTYSDHFSMEAVLRTQFFSAIQSAIDRHGGTITLHDTIDLELWKK